jgi:hypothetical protein
MVTRERSLLTACNTDRGEPANFPFIPFSMVKLSVTSRAVGFFIGSVSDAFLCVAASRASKEVVGRPSYGLKSEELDWRVVVRADENRKLISD